MKNEIRDKIIDNVIDEVIPEYVEEVKYEENNDATFSKEHEDKMNKLFNQVKSRETKKIRIRIITRVAAVVVIGAFAMLLFSPNMLAFRMKILNLIIHGEDEYSWVEFGEGSGESRIKPEEQKAVECFGYIPEGFEIDEVSTHEKVMRIILKNSSDKKFSLKVLNNTMKLGMDTENANYEVLKIDEKEVFYTEKDGIYTYYWLEETSSYTLAGNISREDLEKLIENLNYEKIKEI